MMNTRSEQLRRRSRRVFVVSFLVAAVLHVAILFGMPAFHAVLPDGPASAEGDVVSVATRWQRFDVEFGPPEITDADRRIWVEPATRVLRVQDVEISDLREPVACDGRTLESIVPTSGRVRVRLAESGRVTVATIAESTGDACRDDILTAIAASVWYHWIPNDRFPAPVDLVQPLSVTEARM